MLTHEDFIEDNDYIIKAVKDYPDRFVGFCTVTPLHGRFALDEVRRCVEQGLKGIKLYPPGHGFYMLNHEMIDPLMNLARELDLPVITHTDFNVKICTPYQARILALRHPEVPLIMAHYGGDMDMVCFLPEIVKDTSNLFLECSTTPDLPQIIFSTPSREIGADRLAFGSDTPYVSPEVNLKKLQVAEELYGLSKDDKRKILGETATRILKLKV